MLSDIMINKVLGELFPALTSSLDETTLSKQFLSSIMSDFGIEDAQLDDIVASRKNDAEEYTINTRKPYVDNQLSEYSSFPSLINYKSMGYRSCAILPIIGNGKVTYILRLLSKEENKFGDDMLRAVQLVSAFFGFSMLYKAEAGKNARLAGYFDAAFDSSVPQLLVSQDGRIVKANKDALAAFGPAAQKGEKAESLFGVGFGAPIAAPLNVGRDINVNANGLQSIYRVSTRKVGDGLLHVSAVNTTGAALLNAFLGSLEENRDIYLLVTKQDLIITSSSANFEAVMNYPNAVSRNKRFSDFLKESDARNLAGALLELKHGHTTVQLNLLAGDHIVPIKALFAQLPGGYLIVAISAEADAYVHEAEENISSFIQSTQDVALKVDRLGYITECNLPVESVLGYAKDELLGREARSLYCDSKKFDEGIAYVRNGGRLDNFYVDLVKKDSAIVPCVQAMRMLRGSKENEGYLIMLRELATKRELAHLQAELKKAQSAAKTNDTVSKQKSEFIYDITHELKTPLTNIKGFSSLLYEGQAGELTDGQKDYVKTIIDEADRLVQIIQQVLDAAKLEAEKVRMEFKDIDLKSLADNPAIKSLAEAARQKGLEFKWDVDYNVPGIAADQNRLLQVFVNLIGNSIKFTERGSVKVRAFLKTNRTVECDVVDTGAGIAEEDKKKLFKKFYQASSKELTLKENSGTGLGLVITRSIVRLHKGKIGFESKLGSGSKFWFTLPVNRQARKRQL